MLDPIDPAAGGPAITDRDEWLRPEAVHDEVVLEVGEVTAAAGSLPAGAPRAVPPAAGRAVPAGMAPMAPPPVGGLLLRLRLIVTPAGRHVHLTVGLDGVRARHDADEPGPPPTNWDRMRLGGVEWRMVEPLRRWDLSVEDLEAGLRGYLTFSGTAPPARIFEGYEQVGVASGQVQVAELRTTVTNAPARRTHVWR